MKTKIMLAFLVITLAACAPAQTSTTDIQNTAVAIVQTGVVLTQTAMPTATLPPPTFTPTALPTSTPPATATLTQPIVPILTPDTIQVERWNEYQTELAKALLYGYGPDSYKDALCEWDILGRSNQKIYVWGYCATLWGGSGSLPAVIQLGADGSIQNVEVPEINNLTWDSQILKMFPEDVRNKFDFYTGNSLFVGRVKEMMNHIDYRQTHPEEPPLVVLLATPTP